MVKRLNYSVQLKFAATFFVLIAGLLILLNTYPVIQFRDLVFSSKKAAMQNQAQVLSSSLAPLEALTSDGVRQVMDILDVMPLSRIIVTDGGGCILYDTADTASDLGSFALFSEISRALSGKAVWYSRLADGAFMSRAALPVRSRGVTIGAVYLCEYDTEQALLMNGIRTNLRSVSLAVSVIAFFIIFAFTRKLTGRITELVKAVHRVREGEYDYRMALRGNDELAELGKEFNNLTDRLQSTEEARRRFVSDASHELKTPLASIRLLSDSILQTEEMDMATVREFVQDIGNESERLRRTTEKLLSLTRPEQAEAAALTPVDMGGVAKDTLHLLSPLAEQYAVRLEYRLAEDCHILAAEDDIYEIIFNLVENAIKYNRPGGEVMLTLSRADGQVSMYVDDTGIGIPEEDMPHIFSRFYRVDKARASVSGGSGLGLSIVQNAVTFYGGTVEAEPLSPEGTRFHVSFPLYIGPQAVETEGGAT